SEEDLLDLEILDAVAGLFAQLVTEGEALAKNFGIPVFVIKALHMLDTPLAMKDLGRRMHCDPSFITSIADTLEKYGLAAREADPAHGGGRRRAPPRAGAGLRGRTEARVLSRAPWRQPLPKQQRASLLALPHTMCPPLSAEMECPGEGVSKLLADTAEPVSAA